MSEKNNDSPGDEFLILVDSEDNILGQETRTRCHLGDGLLHRGFSVYVFDDSRRLLLQKRSARKQLWPGYWSNSCCSHPRPEESSEEAAHRRMGEELGLSIPLRYLFQFQYQEKFADVGSENEICSVFTGRHQGSITSDREEIEDWMFVDIEELDVRLRRDPEIYSPWFRLGWGLIRQSWLDKI